MSNKDRNQTSPNKLFVVIGLVVILVAVLLIVRQTNTEVTEDTGDEGKTIIYGELEEPMLPDELPLEDHDGADIIPPTAYLVDDFRGPAKSWENYKFTNLKVTENGVVIDDFNRRRENAPCHGVLESPALLFQHPSSTIGAVYREKLEDATTMYVEVALSPDNQFWSPWILVEPGEYAPEEFYPDGRYNPNYGCVVSDPVGTGLDLSVFCKYRVTLVSGNCMTSPVLQEMRVYHSDSTLGDGKPAVDYGEPAPEPLVSFPRDGVDPEGAAAASPPAPSAVGS